MSILDITEPDLAWIRDQDIIIFVAAPGFSANGDINVPVVFPDYDGSAYWNNEVLCNILETAYEPTIEGFTDAIMRSADNISPQFRISCDIRTNWDTEMHYNPYCKEFYIIIYIEWYMIRNKIQLCHRNFTIHNRFGKPTFEA